MVYLFWWSFADSRNPGGMGATGAPPYRRLALLVDNRERE
jgi:hypothetical protein